MSRWTDGHLALAERMHEAWTLSGRVDPFGHDMEAWRGFALLVMARESVVGHTHRHIGVPGTDHGDASVCECGDFVPDSSGDAGCGNCGADREPDPLPDPTEETR